MHRLESWLLYLLEKSSFPKVLSVQSEHKKIGLIRPLLALILIARFGQIIYGHYIFSESLSVMMISLIIALSASLLFFLVGFFTPITTLILAFLVIRFDAMSFTITLGTAILAQLLIVLGLSGAGRHYSIDSLLLNGNHFISKGLNRVYRIFVPDSEARLTAIYAIGFLSYAVVSFGALGFHLQDEYWISGRTTALFFNGAYLSHFYEVFRVFEAGWAGLYNAWAVGLIIGQSIFQFLMIPLMFHRLGRLFVIFWGWSFFISSLILIELSYLPHIEIILWWIIMHPLAPMNRVQILFDDRCNLCKKSMRFFRFINYNQAMEFLPLSQSEEVITRNNLSYEEVRVWMYGLANGNVYRGYDLYIEIAKNNALMWFFLALLYIGKWTKIGYYIYAVIAKNRYTYFGTCELSPPVVDSDEKPETRNYVALRYWSVLWLIVTLTYVAVRFPVSSFYTWKFAQEYDMMSQLSIAKKVVYSFGFDLPYVFNENDLLLNERWPVLYRVKGDSLDLVPYMSPGGSKKDFLGLDYLWFDNHGSDLFYFGNSLGYVRGIIDQDVREFHSESGLGTELLNTVIKADQYLYCPECETYVVKVYENRCIRKSDTVGADPYEARLIHTDTLYTQKSKIR